MPKGSRIVDERNTVQDVVNFTVAVNGVAKSIGRALVAENGTSREFWPPTTTPCDPIVMTTATETSWDIEAVNSPTGVPKALCNYDARTGRLVLSANDGTESFVQVINPAPRGKGLYLFKVDVLSGTVDGSPTGVWTDVLSLETVGVFEYSVSNNTNTVGQEVGSLNFSIAEDDGVGAPVGGTEVVKQIDFIAELTGSNLTMTTIPWNLECIKVQEDAIVHVLTTPVESEGEAFVTGNECNQEVIREIYALIWNGSFSVQVDDISGDPIQGEVSGVLLDTTVRRTWYLEADTDGEDFTSVIDLTITDGQDSVTKRISIHVSRTDEDTDPGSDISTDFTQFDSIKDLFLQPDEVTPLHDTLTKISFLPDGTVTAETSDGPYINFPQLWNTDSPSVTDPENFEIRCTQLQGDDIPDGNVLDMWLNLSSEKSWQYEVLVSDFGNNFRREIIEFGEFTLEVREVGRPDTVQSKRIFMQCGISPFEWDQTGDN